MPSDEELMVAHREGDPAAFRELFARYGSLLIRMFTRDLHQPVTAEDLVQQTFLHLHRARADYDAAQPFKPWLFAIALNVKREYFRMRWRRPEQALGGEVTELGAAPDPHLRSDARGCLRWALGRIPTDQREVIELHWFAGLSYPEIALSLGIGAVAAKVRAHRGYTRLRELLTVAESPPAAARTGSPL
jgi:RNA polymerase sigma-70 factor (ECF subfamily)